MQVFKSRTFKRIYSVVSFVVIFAIVYTVITKELADTTYASYFENDIKAIVENEEDVELIFFGASRLYHAVIPEVFEEKLGYDNVLIAATAMQPISGTYYYMKDMLETVQPERIIIDVTWDRLLNERAIQPDLLIYDRLSLNSKITYVRDCLDSSDWKYLLGPCRYRDNILVYDQIKAEKEEIAARSGVLFDPENDYYAGKGFVFSYSSFATGNVPFERDTEYEYSNEKIIEESLFYLDKCIELCKENNIEVTLVTVPGTISYLYMVEGYEEFINWCKEYADEKGISYHNLDYLRGREEFLPDECMYDVTHTNAEGAKIVSEIYSDILLKERKGEDVSAYFYGNFEELEADIHRIAAVNGLITFTSETIDSQVVADISIMSLQKEDIVPWYQVEMIDEQGNVTVLVEWTQDAQARLLLPLDTHYSIKVRAKTGNEGDIEAYQVYNY